MTKTNSLLVVTLLAAGLYEVSGFNSPGYLTPLGWVCPPTPLVFRVAADAGPAPVGLDVPTLLAICIDAVGESHPATAGLLSALAAFGPAGEGAPLVPAPKKRKKKDSPAAPAPASAVVPTDDEDEPEETSDSELFETSTDEEDDSDDADDVLDTNGKEDA